MVWSMFYQGNINIGQNKKEDIRECEKTQSIMYKR